ncbi:MAG: glycosyltransferase [Patescibacteria group bacterium]|nr:glycosyltransferase [Patescibacteria group bacterium]
MRVILATESYRFSSSKPPFSGVTVFVDRLAGYLAAKGHQVMIIAPAPDFLEGSVSEQKISDNLLVEYLSSWPNPFRSSSRTVAPFGLAAVKKLMDGFRPEIVHLQDSAGIGVAVLRAAKKRGIPAVITSHSYLEFVSSYLRFFGPLDKMVGKAVLDHIVRVSNECDALTAPTRDLSRTLRRSGVSTKIYTVSNGVELQRFFPGPTEKSILTKYNLPAGKRMIFYVGRLDKDKSLETVLKAAPLITAACKKAHFVFVGEGSSREEYVEIADDLGVAKHISWVGHVAHGSEDLPKLYRLARVFIMPSVEGQSIAALEAMASGLPVVAANAGGLRELVKDGRAGALFKYGDPKSLSAALVPFLLDKNKAVECGKRSRAEALNHDLEKSLAQMENIYEAVIKQNQ